MEIEDDKETQKNTVQRAGRKPKYESRATEFRQELLTRKQTPESLRPSLRALARELDTSHQLLTFYLKGLDRWLAKEQAKRIRARARSESRGMTMRECYGAILLPGLLDQIEKLRRDARRVPLNSHQVKILKLFAKQGFSGAKEILEKCRQMTLREERQARNSERKAMFTSAALNNIERIKQAAERGQVRGQDIEMLKLFERRRVSGAKELLEKCSQTGAQ